ncbi:WG repeat protein [Chitinophaga niastensis]|uniref:WG repeat protein n=1 Tax=Chitinophaga niastensis TaxID=536980 RepID=A0A2P8HF83_CHINA|nr:WG repeat-containing protein [Chitinophaga niastensis]PSL44861.1 WG repeat protein [Chitinophaga niastensis]
MNYMVLPFNNNLVTVQNGKEGKQGVMDASGKLIIPMEFDGVRYDKNVHLILAFKTGNDEAIQGLTSFFDINGHLIMPAQYYVFDEFTDGLLLVKDKAHKNYFIDSKGKVVIDASQYYDVKNFSDGLALVGNKERKYGFINNKGVLVIPFIYNTAYPFNLGITMVCRDNGNNTESALINTQNAVVVPFKESHAYSERGEGIEKIWTMQGKDYDAWGKPKLK